MQMTQKIWPSLFLPYLSDRGPVKPPNIQEERYPVRMDCRNRITHRELAGGGQKNATVMLHMLNVILRFSGSSQNLRYT